ncbi:MAG: hypothetical protein H0V35_14955 [Nitrospira sp.]|nr:hypothetical protein [Nitrospira sp.]
MGRGFAVALSMLFPLLSPFPAAAEESTVFTLAANGSRNTRPFTVKDHWEIRWTVPERMLSVTVYRSNPKNDLDGLGVATVSQLKPGS